MANVPDNIYQNVQTYQKSELAVMMNECPLFDLANKDFIDFQTKEAQLGDTVTFDLTPRATTQNGLVVSAQPSVQRVASLSCTQAVNSSAAYSGQERIFNADVYMERFGIPRAIEVGGKIEVDLGLNFISQVRVNDPQHAQHGQIVDSASGPYRFFGTGAAIGSYKQLVQAQTNFDIFGAARDNMVGIIPSEYMPTIVDNGLSQFATNRGNEDASKWEFSKVGNFSWQHSNLLPVHYAGTVGDQDQTLTLVSTNDPTGANITQLTFSGATPNDQNAFKTGDMCQFFTNVGSLPNVYYRTFNVHHITSLPAQFRVLGDAAANGSGNVTINITPALVSAPGINQNISVNLQAGMQIFAVPSHKAGCIMSGRPLYLAMPKLKEIIGFPSVSTTDEETGASMRHYWGDQLGQNSALYVWDAIWGSFAVAENMMRIIFPLS